MKIDLDLTAADVLRMAEQIEADGAAFYRQVADRAAITQQRDRFLHLAAQEDQHRAHFAALRSLLQAQQARPKASPRAEDETTIEFLQSWLNSELLERSRHKTEAALASSQPGLVIDVAAELETESIAFYSGFLDLITDETDRGLVKKIIKDEMGHLAVLNKMRQRPPAGGTS